MQQLLTNPILEDKFGENIMKQVTPHQPKTTRSKSSKLSEMVVIPKVNPRKIVLEMDIIDKSKLIEEKNNKPKEFVKGAGGQQTLDINEQIELVRR